MSDNDDLHNTSEVFAGMVVRHYKNNQTYQVIGVALQTETNEKLVVYKPLYTSEYELFARPYGMFVEAISHNGCMVQRFQKVDL